MSPKQTPEVPTPELVYKDVWIPRDDEQIISNEKTGARTIHTALEYPNGDKGFIIIGCITDKEWHPLETLKQIVIEYENPSRTEKDSVQA